MTEFLPTISPDDPSYEVRMHGLGQLGEGGVDMVSGALMMFAQASVAERRRLAGACSDHLGDFTRLWAPEQCEQVASRLAATLRGERDDEVRRTLDRMTDQMRGCGTSAHP